VFCPSFFPSTQTLSQQFSRRSFSTFYYLPLLALALLYCIHSIIFGVSHQTASSLSFRARSLYFDAVSFRFTLIFALKILRGPADSSCCHGHDGYHDREVAPYAPGFSPVFALWHALIGQIQLHAFSCMAIPQHTRLRIFV
jgi:hypothetical protein